MNLNPVCLKIMGKLTGYDYQRISELYDMKVPSLGITQHFADEIEWVLDLTIGIDSPRSMMIVVLTTLLVADM
jgi:hypothetical protein